MDLSARLIFFGQFSPVLFAAVLLKDWFLQSTDGWPILCLQGCLQSTFESLLGDSEKGLNQRRRFLVLKQSLGGLWQLTLCIPHFLS